MAKKDEKKDKDPNEEGLGSKLLSGLFVFLIIVVWLAILIALVKLDIGGFGNDVLRPVIKDIPVINKILPEPTDEQLEEEAMDAQEDQVATMSQAKDMIAQLQAENEKLTSKNKKLKEENKDLKGEIERLKQFEDTQNDFQKQKEQFYNEIVYGDKAPDADTYKEWYESIDAANAEAIYRQVISNNQQKAEMKDLAKTYENMKASEAAKTLEAMGDWYAAASILSAMKADSRAKVMNEMDPDFAANMTKIMMP